MASCRGAAADAFGMKVLLTLTLPACTLWLPTFRLSASLLESSGMDFVHWSGCHEIAPSSTERSLQSNRLRDVHGARIAKAEAGCVTFRRFPASFWRESEARAARTAADEDLCECTFVPARLGCKTPLGSGDPDWECKSAIGYYED